MKLGKYSLGTGDRFAKEAEAQLQAVMEAKRELDIDITIVWNKSYREHSIIHTNPESVRAAADRAIQETQWEGKYYVDADHINLKTVDLFINSSDFFTLDVAEFIGRTAPESDITAFLEKYRPFLGNLSIPKTESSFTVTEDILAAIAKKYLLAAREAGKIYRRIEKAKGKNTFITEVSMDETKTPQSPIELFFILAALAGEGIPLQTIAPKFTGRFNKGVDYIGNVDQFEKEFNEDLCVLSFAVQEFGLPEDLKLSIHSGSDKFSLYPVIRKALTKHDAGLHIKTAGTTWLEELIGLAESGGEGLAVAKEIYTAAYRKYDELCKPYEDVIDIDREKLPSPEEVLSWNSQKYVSSLRHDRTNPAYNRHLRQLLHVGYKIAADMGNRYVKALDTCRPVIRENVTKNLFERHIKPLFHGGIK